MDLALEFEKDSGAYGFKTDDEATKTFLNPDTPGSPDHTVPYILSDTRHDGTPLGSPKLPGEKDVLAFTSIYSESNPWRAPGSKPAFYGLGSWLVLWDDGTVGKVPDDQTLLVPVQRRYRRVFPNQPGSGSNLVSAEEQWTGLMRSSNPLPLAKPIPQGKEEATADNGGPESLVTFSRLLSFPSRYGIEREELWKNFDPAQAEFTLADVQAGAAKLKLPLELKALSLDELQKLQAPAIFLTSDDKRIVVLSQLDDKEAIVIDRGLTRIVPRDLLALRYGGQALVAASALAPAANAPQVLAEDAVRPLSLTSPDQVLQQTVKITNAGGSPLTLQIERPIPGCEKAELSAPTIAPGESATLSLTLRWRSVLKSPTQNVLVFLATNDPRRPRLPLGFKLSLPQPANAAP